MSKSKIIFTADDFGVDDSINEGIIDLARAGVLHSVEVLPNYGQGGQQSLENTQQLLEQTQATNPGLELGVHLTITSGKPVSGTQGLSSILSNGHFISARKTNSGANPKALGDELRRQIEVLKSDPQIWNRVTHLTNHHDALWFFPEYTAPYIDVATEYGLPIRNPRVFPSLKSAWYYKYLGPRNASSGDKRKSREAYRLREAGKFASRDLTYRSTHYLDSSHYSLFRTILEPNTYAPDKFIKRRQKELRKIFERLQGFHQESPQLAEVLFHVRKGSINNSRVRLSDEERAAKGFDAFDEFDLPHYNGITTSYFDGRSVEYASLFWEHSSGGLKKLFDDHQVDIGKWTDCVELSLAKV